MIFSNENSKGLSKKVVENIKKIYQWDIKMCILLARKNSLVTSDSSIHIQVWRNNPIPTPALSIIIGNKKCVLDQESIIKIYKEVDINIK